MAQALFGWWFLGTVLAGLVAGGVGFGYGVLYYHRRVQQAGDFFIGVKPDGALEVGCHVPLFAILGHEEHNVTTYTWALKPTEVRRLVSDVVAARETALQEAQTDG